MFKKIDQKNSLTSNRSKVKSKKLPNSSEKAAMLPQKSNVLEQTGSFSNQRKSKPAPPRPEWLDETIKTLLWLKWWLGNWLYWVVLPGVLALTVFGLLNVKAVQDVPFVSNAYDASKNFALLPLSPIASSNKTLIVMRMGNDVSGVASDTIQDAMADKFKDELNVVFIDRTIDGSHENDRAKRQSYEQAKAKAVLEATKGTIILYGRHNKDTVLLCASNGVDYVSNACPIFVEVKLDQLKNDKQLEQKIRNAIAEIISLHLEGNFPLRTRAWTQRDSSIVEQIREPLPSLQELDILSVPRAISLLKIYGYRKIGDPTYTLPDNYNETIIRAARVLHDSSNSSGNNNLKVLLAHTILLMPVTNWPLEVLLALGDLAADLRVVTTSNSEQAKQQLDAIDLGLALFNYRLDSNGTTGQRLNMAIDQLQESVSKNNLVSSNEYWLLIGRAFSERGAAIDKRIHYKDMHIAYVRAAEVVDAQNYPRIYIEALMGQAKALRALSVDSSESKFDSYGLNLALSLAIQARTLSLDKFPVLAAQALQLQANVLMSLGDSTNDLDNYAKGIALIANQRAQRKLDPDSEVTAIKILMRLNGKLARSTNDVKFAIEAMRLSEELAKVNRNLPKSDLGAIFYNIGSTSQTAAGLKKDPQLAKKARTAFLKSATFYEQAAKGSDAANGMRYNAFVADGQYGIDVATRIQNTKVRTRSCNLQTKLLVPIENQFGASNRLDWERSIANCIKGK
jgi:hypothetical protein